MYKILYKIIPILFLLPSLVFAQNVVTGTVSDEVGPLPGATVYEKDVPTNGAATDIDGKFSLALRGESKVLVVKSIGLLTKEVSVKGKTSIKVFLEKDAKGLEEVVVVGFGTQKKITNTGAISTITAQEIKQNPSASIQNTLAGRLPGFFSQQRSGQPGADGAQFFIRGISTYDGVGAPLIIVDDIEYDYEKVSALDPNEIESVSILKDASTTAVYGIKGANGVLIVTTKRGNVGKPKINFKSEAGYQTDVYSPKFLDSYQALSLRNETIEQYGDTTNNPQYLSEEILQKYRDGSDPYLYPNVDWWNTAFKKGAMITRNNLDFQGGSKTVKYFVSAGYLWQNGNLRDFGSRKETNNNFYYKRYNFRSNLDIAATKTLKLRLDLSGRFGEQNEPFGLNSSIYANSNGIIGEIYSKNYLPPYAFPILNPDGSYPYAPGLGADNASLVGRISELGYSRRFDNDLGIVAAATQDLDFVTKGLSAKVLVSYGSNQFYRVGANRTVDGIPFYYFNPNTNSYSPRVAEFYRPDIMQVSYASGDILRTLNSQSHLNYRRSFGKHTAYALALFNDSRIINQKSVDDENQGEGIPTVTTGSTFRVGYDFANKYILEFNAAYNGTDRFEKSKRNSWFPAASIGWNVAEEEFFKERFDFFNLFKIRASYGLVGSDDTKGARKYLQFYTVGIEPNVQNNIYYNFGPNRQRFPSLFEGRLGNNAITWQKEKKLDIGLDLSAFDGLVKLTVDYFDNERYDILTTRKSVPSTLGVPLPPVNLGRVQNRGIDGELNLTKRFKNGFYADFRLTYSRAVNKILYQDEAEPAYPWLAATGHPVNQAFGWTAIGFYTQEDIDNNVAQPTSKVGPGDLKYADLNGDNVIDDSDRGPIGKPNLPSDVWGTNFNFGYKNFYLNVFFQGAFNYSTRFNSETIHPGASNFQPVHLGRWTPETAETATFPRLGGGAATNFPNATANNSTFWLRDNYYVRLKTAEFSYVLPAKFTKRMGLSSIRAYTNANNLLTWTNITDLYQVDPENGVDAGTSVNKAYPTQRIYNLGLMVTF